MSHYSVAVAVVTHDNPSRAGIDNEVAMALEPYNEEGKWGKPGSHWDWWVIGGRWENELIDKVTGEFCDFTSVKNIDFERMAYEQVVQLKKRYAEANPYVLSRRSLEETEDEYVRRYFLPFYTHAFVDLDGEWHEQGQVGFFGTTSGTMEAPDWQRDWKRMFDALPDYAQVVIVDCHV